MMQPSQQLDTDARWRLSDQQVLDRSRRMRVLPGGREADTIEIVDRPAREGDWHLDVYRLAGTALLQRLEEAVAANRDALADRTRAELLETIHADRLARAHDVAASTGRRLDAVGRGPVPDRPTVHSNRRGAWYVCPLTLRHIDILPDATRKLVRDWQVAGDVFDALLLADELTPSGTASEGLVSCLIGVASADGGSGDWFVLDRWQV